MRDLFGGNGALPDFLFYEENELKDFMKNKKESPIRTTLKDKQKIKLRPKSPVQEMLLEAWDYVEQGRYVSMIRRWARRLHRTIKKVKHRQYLRHRYYRRFMRRHHHYGVKAQRQHYHHNDKRDMGKQSQNDVNDLLSLDVGRMRNAASFTYSGQLSCTPEGGKVSSSHGRKVTLCETCYGYVDFGPNV